MSKGKKHVSDSIRLPGEIVETLKVMAESEGERGYQTMVRKWIEERLHQEARK
jgi:predicted DNA-binding protein